MHFSFSPFLFLLGLLTTLSSWGQVDSTYRLGTVEIKATKIRQLPVGSPRQIWESEALENSTANHLASLLNEKGGVYIKNYGIGSLATSSIRGGSSGHTLVLWNGLPLQSPMLGLLDLSFLPTAGAEEITFQKGGNTALWGSGAIGGLVSLKNQTDFKDRFSIKNQTTLGSFGYLQEQAQLKLGNSSVQSSTKFFYEKGENDFEFRPAPSLPKQRQTNAHFTQQNILQDFYWKVNQHHQLNLHFWRQDIHRAIPPTIVQNSSVAYQEDWSNRLLAHWKHIGNNAIWEVKTGFFDESQDFVNERIQLTAHNHFQSFFGELTRQWDWREQHQFFLGGTHTYTKAQSKNYAQAIPEHKSALFFSWKWQQANWAMQTSIRQEMVEGALVPLVPVLGLQYYLAPFLNIQLKISKNYRLPTLNDRYWKPGGNPALQPESGWSEEVSLQAKHKKNNWQLEYTLTGFNRQIDNWILWTLAEQQNFWSAHNLSQVWSRGIEQNITLQYQSSEWRTSLNIGYDYIRSTNQVAIELPRIAKGDQLLYTPIHQASGKIDGHWKGWYGSYHHQFIGSAIGINEAIPAYQLGTIRLQYSLAGKNYQSKLFFNLYNIWDAQYVIVERRPMAGRHYQLGISFHLNRKKKV